MRHHQKSNEPSFIFLLYNLLNLLCSCMILLESKRSKAYSSLVGPWAVAPKPQNLRKLHGAGPVLQRNHNAENPCKLHSIGRWSTDKTNAFIGERLVKGQCPVASFSNTQKTLSDSSRYPRDREDTLSNFPASSPSKAIEAHSRLRWRKFVGLYEHAQPLLSI